MRQMPRQFSNQRPRIQINQNVEAANRRQELFERGGNKSQEESRKVH